MFDKEALGRILTEVILGAASLAIAWSIASSGQFSLLETTGFFAGLLGGFLCYSLLVLARSLGKGLLFVIALLLSPFGAITYVWLSSDVALGYFAGSMSTVLLCDALAVLLTTLRGDA